VAGGLGSQGFNPVGRAELYDPATGTWVKTAELNNPRRLHTATSLLSGEVLVAGGMDNFQTFRTVELFLCTGSAD